MSEAVFDPVAHARSMRERGFWIDKYYDEFFANAVALTPDKLALVAYRADRADVPRLTYAEFGSLVAKAAASLQRLGIIRGDVVSVQLPNWWEFAVIALASFRVGAVLNPLLPIFRENELSFMLDFAATKLLVVPKSFRGFDHAAMANGLQGSLPTLKHIAVVDDDGPTGFGQILLNDADQLSPSAASGSQLPTDEMAVLMFTSGTTGSPKGVMQCFNALMACSNGFIDRLGLESSDILLACSPLGHMTGLLSGLLTGVKLGATVVLQDVWDANRALKIMADEKVTYASGAAVFLSDMCEAVANGAPKPKAFRRFLCAGAPIPPVIIERVRNELGALVSSGWGMTESLASTITEPERAVEKSSKADGRPLDCMAIKVVKPDGDLAAIGETGLLKVRGAMMTLGYYKRPDLELFDSDGWFDTGDLAYIDDEGYIRINGRTKDVVIRGGENIPVMDIENLLFKHSAVLSTAVVGFPDSRLGERVCAFVQLRPGKHIDLKSIQTYLAEHKVAKQYWPERVEILDDLPKTPSGKVQKFVLREQAKAFGNVN
jgi:cyclohexanecarboxylate-CoA ligase